MASKMKVHAIVGSGSAPTKVIQEGLRDAVSKKDAVSLVWQGPPSDTLEDVYDYVMDNEIQFQMFYADGTTPARVFRESEHGAVQKVRDPFKAALQSVAGGSVLFLWNEDEDDDQIEPVFELVERGTLVLELTNGLAPISIDMDIPEPVEPELAKDEDDDEDDDSDFTKEELEIMTPFAVKRYGERKGCAAKTKSGIIAELFPEVGGEDEEEGEVEPPPTAVSAAAAPSPAPLIKEADLELERLLDNETDLSNILYTLNEALSQINSVLTQLATKVYGS